MRESVGRCLDNQIPGDDPVSVRLDFAGRLRSSEANFVISNSSEILFDRDDMVQGAEYGVEVDWAAPDDVIPLG